MARFEASRCWLLGATRPLADVAAELRVRRPGATSPGSGSELAGCPPTTWLREEFPFLQDHDGARHGSLKP